jgi:hypothetical protein
MILAKGEPTWWGEVSAFCLEWFGIANPLTIVAVLAVGLALALALVRS